MGASPLDVAKLVDDVFHKGWDEFQEFVNPLIAQRAIRFLRVRQVASNQASRGSLEAGAA